MVGDDALDLVGATEIAEMLGLTRQRVQQLAKTSDFPAPAVTLRMGAAWHTADIRAWAADKGRDLRGDDTR